MKIKFTKREAPSIANGRIKNIPVSKGLVGIFLFLNRIQQSMITNKKPKIKNKAYGRNQPLYSSFAIQIKLFKSSLAPCSLLFFDLQFELQIYDLFQI